MRRSTLETFGSSLPSFPPHSAPPWTLGFDLPHHTIPYPPLGHSPPRLYETHPPGEALQHAARYLPSQFREALLESPNMQFEGHARPHLWPGYPFPPTDRPHPSWFYTTDPAQHAEMIRHATAYGTPTTQRNGNVSFSHGFHPMVSGQFVDPEIRGQNQGIGLVRDSSTGQNWGSSHGMRALYAPMSEEVITPYDALGYLADGTEDGRPCFISAYPAKIGEQPLYPFVPPGGGSTGSASASGAHYRSGGHIKSYTKASLESASYRRAFLQEVNALIKAATDKPRNY